MTDLHPLWLVGIGIGTSLLPFLIGGLTSYLKVNIVIGMIKSALGVQHAPGMIAEMVLALAVTSFVMGPTFHEVSVQIETLSPTLLSEAPTKETLRTLLDVCHPWKQFLARHAGSHEIEELYDLQFRLNEKRLEKKKDPQQTLEKPSSPEALSISLLLPAFILTELKEAFLMGFCLLLPFLFVDLVVANILAGLGMQMVSPTLISLPLKVFLFVLTDGWVLLTKALILSYQGG